MDTSGANDRYSFFHSINKPSFFAFGNRSIAGSGRDDALGASCYCCVNQNSVGIDMRIDDVDARKLVDLFDVKVAFVSVRAS